MPKPYMWDKGVMFAYIYDQPLYTTPDGEVWGAEVSARAVCGKCGGDILKGQTFRPVFALKNTNQAFEHLTCPAEVAP